MKVSARRRKSSTETSPPLTIVSIAGYEDDDLIPEAPGREDEIAEEVLESALDPRSVAEEIIGAHAMNYDRRRQLLLAEVMDCFATYSLVAHTLPGVSWTVTFAHEEKNLRRSKFRIHNAAHMLSFTTTRNASHEAKERGYWSFCGEIPAARADWGITGEHVTYHLKWEEYAEVRTAEDFERHCDALVAARAKLPESLKPK